MTATQQHPFAMSDRYTVLGSIAKGGMGVVYLGRMAGSAGFSRLVAIKRLHRELAAERAFVAGLVDEARMSSRIRHANVIDTLDLVVSDGAFSLVLEYIEGDALSSLVEHALRLGEKVPRSIALSIMYGVLRGLDAAHDARTDDGAPLGIVHRDMSPQNVLVGVDGVPRVIDFGVAKALGKLEATRPGEVRGKVAYMAPEQLSGKPVTRQADVYAAGVVLWELLANRRLFTGESWRDVVADVTKGNIPSLTEVDPEIPADLDAVVKKATSLELSRRYFTMREFLAELEPFARASDDEVGNWVRRLAAEELAKRQRLVQDNAPEGDDQSVEDLIRDLAAHDPTKTEALGPLTAAFAPASSPPIATETVTTSTWSPPSAVSPKRYGPLVAVAVATVLVVAFVALRRGGGPPTPAASADEDPKPFVVPAVAVAVSASVPVPEPVPVATEPTPAVPAPTTSTRREPPLRRPHKPAPAPYDPGNFR